MRLETCCRAQKGGYRHCRSRQQSLAARAAESMQQVTEACPKSGRMVQHTYSCTPLFCHAAFEGTTTDAGLTKTTELHRTPVAADIVRIDRLDRHGEQEREQQDDKKCIQTQHCIRQDYAMSNRDFG